MNGSKRTIRIKLGMTPRLCYTVQPWTSVLQLLGISNTQAVSINQHLHVITTWETFLCEDPE